MDEAIAHSEENTNPAMLYLHDYLAQSNNHQLFDICLGLLPSDNFSETASGPPCHHSRVATGRASAMRNRGGRPSGMSRVSGGSSGSRGRKAAVSAEENAVCASMSAKNKIISHKSVSALSSAAVRDLQVQQDRKHMLTSELANNIGGPRARKDAKDRIAFYKLAKKDSESDSEDNDSYVESQESLIKSIIECEALIAEYETHHCKNKKLVKSSLIDLTNKS